MLRDLFHATGTHTAKEIAKGIFNHLFSIATDTKSRNLAARGPPERESKTSKMQEEFLLRSLPTRKSLFSLHTLILRLSGSLCEMLCAYKKGLRGLSLKAALGIENIWQILLTPSV